MLCLSVSDPQDSTFFDEHRRTGDERSPDNGDQAIDDSPTHGQSQSPTILVGIPAYNEASTVRDVVAAVQPHADEVLVVDDGSTDDTGEQARAADAVVVRHETNQGYGATLGTIFRCASEMGVDHLVIVDADGQHDAADIPDLVRTQQVQDVDIVTGTRFSDTAASSMPVYRRFGLAVINLCTNIGLKLGYSYRSLSDTQCGFRVYNSDAIDSMANADQVGTGMGASLDILFQAAREDLDIAEIPTEISYDVAEANTRNPVIHGVDLILSLCLVLIADRPGRVIGTVSGVLSLVGALVLAVLLFGLTVLYLLAGVVALSAGVVGMTKLRDVINTSDRTDQ